MATREYELILDSLQMTAVYVIREDNHKILYYNKRVREIAPTIENGMVCHELWEGACDNCPLLYMGDKNEARSVNYGDPFGEVVEIAATRILWEEEVPAFVIAVTPYAEVANHIYHKVLRGNLTTDSYMIVKADEEEMQELRGHMTSLSDWFLGVSQCGYVYEEDIERYESFVRFDHAKAELKKGVKKLSCIYRRKYGDTYRWHHLEVVPDFDYTDDNQKVMICLKDIHDAFREGLAREEVNIRNQEIINALGETNFAIYVVDLQTGRVNIVQATEKIRQNVDTENSLWDNTFQGIGAGYIASEDRERVYTQLSLESMRTAWENGEKKKTILCRVFLYGTWRYISISAYLKENKKQSGYAILTFQDVDEQTKRDMEQRRNDQRMAAIIRSRYSILSTIDLETGICERFYLRQGVAGRRAEGDYDYYVKKAYKETVVEADRRVFEKTLFLENIRKNAETVQDFREDVCQYRHRGESPLWTEEHVLYIRQGEKTLVNVLGRDITAEKLAEEQTYRESIEKASIINSLSSMFFATYYINLENETLRPVRQKDVVSRVLGDERNYTQAINLYAQNFVSVDDREEYLEYVSYYRLLNTLSVEHPVVAFEYRMLPDQNNRRAWIRASIVLAETTDDGRPKRALYAAQDVTESKLREEREQQALREACDAANYANAAKSDFMSRMSHDIRTPMNAIVGMTAIAGKHLEDTERVEDCLKKITISSRHLLSLINEVLDMSKIESGKIDLMEEEVNLSDLIGSLVTMIRPSMQERKHHFDVHIANVEHERVIGDTMRLQQIFMNILGNAAKYTNPGGTIEMEINEKPFNTYGYGCYEFVFRDNGIGMSKEFLEKLFEPFSRAEDSRVSKVEGTGLGMAIARNIARRMNGDIAVESELGKGTTFVVTLILKLVETQAPDTEKFADLPVLVVDDDKNAVETSCLILENIGMKSEYALSGREAVQRVGERHRRNQDYFAVILDWQMPGMDGIETARAIRKDVGADVPIIILSAYDWSAVEEEARRAGVNGFISKPLFKSRLVYLFNQIMDDDGAKELTKESSFADMKLEGKRILLVEDNVLSREIAEDIIGETGVTVESAKNGQEALKKFEVSGENYYDMILMDIQMPIMNGYEATRAIRKLPRTDATEIPIIALTADAFSEDIQRSKAAGMNEHLTKPLEIDHLMRCIETWLGDEKVSGN
ncbi:PAS domain-containing hybrid sensor histidine kinase/response regulator [Adlercreutzia sp. ZJ138]|uniref:PAS domain-containing hybrid sensor histidine kinase/response regulator n=1 Tax=Adlercreutzia sp. ZJ138 TaxID=2709405 RepID=UPI0013EC1FC1|nr:PAS domain-containing hybrid sensor histidine kinase/response regulator [Adlercreutzia sp. ZJ138]